jgi:hypothetical protein
MVTNSEPSGGESGSCLPVRRVEVDRRTGEQTRRDGEKAIIFTRRRGRKRGKYVYSRGK